VSYVSGSSRVRIVSAVVIGCRPPFMRVMQGYAMKRGAIA